MSDNKIISGFSKLSKNQKIDWLVNNFTPNPLESKDILKKYWNQDEKLQQLHEEFSENTISNFYMPFGIAPNFLINDKIYAIPMVTEESSVIAAASNAAKFWLNKGGFKTKILGNTKIGHVHFIFNGDKENLYTFFNNFLIEKLFEQTDGITKNMRERGGGILDIKLIDKTSDLENYYQIQAQFNTKDSMGANFINSCLEQFSKTLTRYIEDSQLFNDEEKKSLHIIMSILSNYSPDCFARAEVSCKVEDIKNKYIPSEEFAYKFKQAICIAEIEPYRAVTHNKGIMNGVDAVVLSTGNDFRAVEACVHAYASKSGQYKSLTNCKIEKGIFKFWIDLPLALGVVGGLTKLHPMVEMSLRIMNYPSAEELMQICAAVGLAQNYAALNSLISIGIQKGHMKMHLLNILNQLGANQEEKKHLIDYFKNKTINHHNVVEEFNKIKNK